jgi:hypothetical protein
MIFAVLHLTHLLIMRLRTWSCLTMAMAADRMKPHHSPRSSILTNKTPPADYLTLALPDQNFAIIPVLM